MTTVAGRVTFAPAGSPAADTTPTVRAAPARAGSLVQRGENDDAFTQVLLTRLAQLPVDHPDRSSLRDRLIEMHLPLAAHLARRFRHRGEPLDDLVQVARLALVKSVDGYDHSYGTAFTSYAVPMILGELKRHFRDKGWNVRVPRRLQELRLEMGNAGGELTQRLGHSPTAAEMAEYLGVTEDVVIEALECGGAYRAVSLDAPTGDGETAGQVADLLGDVDPDIEWIEQRESLRPLIAKLPQREQKIIALRFFGNMTQTQIADRLGISQMHVSRLLTHALGVLRNGLLA
jgi:RNA polymerase sigma-B factor